MATAQRVIDDALASAMYATRVAVSRTMRTSPGAIAFHRDMLLDVPLVVDYLFLQQR